MTKYDPEQVRNQNYYERLGVARDVDPSAIKHAYKKVAMRFHPDKASENDKDAATECFQHLNEAKTVLLDPLKRNKYDTYLDTGGVGAYDPNADFISWSTGKGWVSVAENIFLCAMGILAIGFVFSSTAYKECRARVPPLVENLIAMANIPFPPDRAKILFSMTNMIILLFILWCTGLAADYLEFISSASLARTGVGLSSVWCAVASLRGVKDPHEDSGIKWWDTSLTSALFAYWYWFQGGTLIPSAIWSFCISTLVSSLVPRLAEEKDIIALSDWVRRSTFGVCLRIAAASMLWSLQHSLIIRGLAALILMSVNATDEKTNKTDYHIRQMQFVAITLFSWCAYGIVWSMVSALIFSTVVQTILPNTRGGFNGLIIIVILWRLVAYIFF